MVTIIKKCENSLALRIPSVIAKDVHLQQGSLVEVSILEGRMIVKPMGECKISLSHMLKGITKNNRHSERNCGGATGREIW